MLTDLQRDILIKAAEGIQEGMWCRHTAFSVPMKGSMGTNTIFNGDLTLDEALSSYRCAMGELGLRTVQLGGNGDDYFEARAAVTRVLLVIKCNGECVGSISSHNDYCMKGDAFSAGQEWAEMFRAASLL